MKILEYKRRPLRDRIENTFQSHCEGTMKIEMKRLRETNFSVFVSLLLTERLSQESISLTVILL